MNPQDVQPKKSWPYRVSAIGALGYESFLPDLQCAEERAHRLIETGRYSEVFVAKIVPVRTYRREVVVEEHDGERP